MNIAFAGLIMVGVLCIVGYFKWMSVQKMAKWRAGSAGSETASRAVRRVYAE